MTIIYTTIDIETTEKLDDDKKTVTSPFFGQQIVSVGFNKKSFNAYENKYLCFYHEEREPTQNAFNILQKVLEDTDILIGHNIKFDLGWLRECGLKYTGKLFDTMVAEYVLLRGQKAAMSLDECCKRRGIPGKKKDEIESYRKNNISFDVIPWDIVEEYGRRDVTITSLLAEKQLEDLGVNSWDNYAKGQVHVSLACD